MAGFRSSGHKETYEVHFKEETCIRGISLLIKSSKQSVLERLLLANVFCLNSWLRCNTPRWSLVGLNTFEGTITRYKIIE